MTDKEVVIEDPKAVLDALTRAKTDAQRYREKLESMQAEVESLQTQLGEMEALREQLSAKSNAVRDMQVKSQLKLDGVSSPERVMKYMDLEKVTLNDANEIEGMDEALSSVKEDFPELFDAKRRVGGQANIHERGANNVVKSTSELQADRLLHRA